jgi:hypothetical protein
MYRFLQLSLVAQGSVCLIGLMLAAGCLPEKPATPPAPISLDLSKDGAHTSGDWTYDYTITSPGTRSEGYHGKLSYAGTPLPTPLHINDFYETPWGPLYWVGNPVVLFGNHGWMPKPVSRGSAGQAMIDPAKVHSDRYLLQVKILSPEELATPDRLETDADVLAALKPFDLQEAHVQGTWFALGGDPVTLHDTKRWGRLTVCRSDTNMRPLPTLGFTSTSDLSLGAAPKPVSLADLMPAPEFLDRPRSVDLSPQVNTLQPVRCTLNPVIGDPLVLYLVCRIQDQGPTPPWTVPGQRIMETETK